MQESLQHVRPFVETAPFPIGVYVGKDMVIELANKSILEIWGKGNDVLGKRFADVLPEVEDQSINAQLDAVFTTGVPFHAENQRVDLFKDGRLQTFYFNYSFTPLYNKAGEVYGVMNSAANVTALNLINKRIDESEKNLRNVLMQAPVAMCILTGEANIVEIANERMLQLWGAKGNVINKPLFEAIPEVKGQGFEDLLRKVYTTGETVKAFAVPVSLPRSGTTEIVFIDFVYEAYRNVTGEITGVMAVAVDVTDQVVARKKIEESEERARLAVESARLGTYEVNFETNELITSARMDEIFNVENSGDRDKFVSAIHPDDLQVREKAFETAKQTGTVSYDARLVWKDGSIHWVRIEGKYLLNKENNPVRLIGVTQDITEQKQFEEELNRLVTERTLELQNKNLQLENINKELEQFTYAASHDMQEPLRKVNTFSSFLLENHAEQLDERGKSYLSRIGTSVLRMKNIIDDLLNYSHQTREEQEFEQVDLNKILQDVEADLEVNIEQKKAVITRDAFPMLVGVPTQMNQLFSNLYSNALKFTNPEVPVVINIRNEMLQPGDVAERNELDKHQQYLKITFSDNGIGFEQQYAEQIFSLFKRLHGKTDYEGTGIGLGLCKKIVQNHRGTIWAQSQPNKGSTFFIMLPIDAFNQP